MKAPTAATQMASTVQIIISDGRSKNIVYSNKATISSIDQMWSAIPASTRDHHTPQLGSESMTLRVDQEHDQYHDDQSQLRQTDSREHCALLLEDEATRS